MQECMQHVRPGPCKHNDEWCNERSVALSRTCISSHHTPTLIGVFEVDKEI